MSFNDFGEHDRRRGGGYPGYRNWGESGRGNMGLGRGWREGGRRERGGRLGFGRGFKRGGRPGHLRGREIGLYFRDLGRRSNNSLKMVIFKL